MFYSLKTTLTLLVFFAYDRPNLFIRNTVKPSFNKSTKIKMTFKIWASETVIVGMQSIYKIYLKIFYFINFKATKRKNCDPINYHACFFILLLSKFGFK